MTLTLRARLSCISTVVFGVLLGAVSLVSYRALASRLDADALARLTELTEGLHGYLHFDVDPPTVAFDAADADQAAFVHDATQYYQIYDAVSARLLVQSPGLAPLGLTFTAAEIQSFRDSPRPFDIRTEYGRFRVSNSVIPRADRVYLLQIGAPLAPVDLSLERFRDLLLWGAAPALLLAALAAWWTSGLALAPLSRFAHAARELDVTSLSRRLPVTGSGDEIDAAAQAFNDAFARLDHAVGEMRQFSAALAHEMRTPLTALRGEIEIAMSLVDDDAHKGRLASQLEEIDKLKRLIAQVLTLARAEAGLITLHFESFNISSLCEELVLQLEPVAQARGIDLRCAPANDVVVEGDADWLKRVLLNLLDNAIKFTGDGGRVEVRAALEGDEAQVVVQDNGVGIAPDAIPHVFDRFVRVDAARTSPAEGAGLGLSLARWIVDRHHGRIRVVSRPGEGATFTISLPRRQA